MGKAFNETLGKMGENPLFKRREGDAKEVSEWNSDVEEAVELAKHIYTGELPPGDMADAALRSARFPAVAKENARLNKELTELRALVGKLQGAGPGVQTQAGGGENAPRKTLSQLIGERAGQGRSG
jgi:hypothetical protein